MFGNRVWKLEQNSEEILYQVLGRRGLDQGDSVKIEEEEDKEVVVDVKEKTGTTVLHVWIPLAFDLITK